VPHLQNPDRVASAAIAVGELGSQLLLLDDGFQHRKLARDFDVVLLDASEPFGFDRLLPAGTLREPVAGLARAHAVVLSRADMLDPAGRDAVRQRVAKINPHAVWCEVEHRPAELVASDGKRELLNPPPSKGGARGGTPAASNTSTPESEATVANPSPVPSLQGRGAKVAAFCGIGNPAGFRHTLATLGCNVAAWREFPDHHGYSREDVESLATFAQEAAREAGAELVLCTRKDLVKLRVPAIGGVPLRAVGVELQFLAGEEALTAALAPIIIRALAIRELNSKELSDSLPSEGSVGEGG
jgi:tetraacyldisaccharide 4'-kinase